MNYNMYIGKRVHTYYNTNDEIGYKVYTQEIQTYKVGKLYSGTNDNAGEIGHVRLTKTGPEGYRKEGSCEGYCSGSGIVRLA
ncbi:MAG: ROK family protein, partial [Clostridia bacterium]|nr:ROK family protein [Clostridia bacterium]